MHLKEYQIIHACDFDTVLPSLVMRILGKKVFLIFLIGLVMKLKQGKAGLINQLIY